MVSCATYAASTRYSHTWWGGRRTQICFIAVHAGPLPPGKTANTANSRLPKASKLPGMPRIPKVPKTFRRAAPAVPQSAPAPPESPPAPPQQSLQTFIPRLNRYMQAKVNRVPGEVRYSSLPFGSSWSLRTGELQPDAASSAWFPSQISSYIDAVTALGTTGAHGAHQSMLHLTESQTRQSVPILVWLGGCLVV